LTLSRLSQALNAAAWIAGSFGRREVGVVERPLDRQAASLAD
jgi:hypothetical protein